MAYSKKLNQLPKQQDSKKGRRQSEKRKEVLVGLTVDKLAYKQLNVQPPVEDSCRQCMLQHRCKMWIVVIGSCILECSEPYTLFLLVSFQLKKGDKTGNWKRDLLL